MSARSTLQVSGYELRKHVFTNDQVTMFNAVRNVDGTRGFLLKPEQETVRQLDIKEEFVLLSQMDSPFVPAAIDLVEDEHTCLVLENVKGLTLKQSHEFRPFSREQLVNLTLRLLDALDDVHSRGYVFANLSVDTVFCHRESMDVVLVDFSMVREHSSQPELKGAVGVTDAPEMLGLSSRTVDERADFHGLGQILFWLVTGRYPIEFDERTNAAQILQTPPLLSVAQVSSDSRLADLVDWLLKPDPEDRPQSTEEIRKYLDPKWSPRPGSLKHFHISQKFYGRSAELKALQSARNALIVGPSGIGKSALAGEACRQTRLSGGAVVSGKFSLEQTGTPYFGLQNVIAGIVDITGTEILYSLGELANWLPRAYPVLESSAREQDDADEEVPEVNQVSAATEELVREACRRDNGLLIFLDDLHWIDNASADIVRRLLAAQIDGLRILAAWRDASSDSGVMTLEELKTEVPDLQEFQLAPLAIDQVEGVLRDSLGKGSEVGMSSRILLEKTHGFPHFLTQMLAEAVRDGHATYDSAACCWILDAGELIQLPPSENVGDILARQLQGYDEEFSNFLKLASCVGHTLTRNVLLDLMRSEDERLDLKHLIDRACAEGILVPQRTQLRFAHDRVHEAVYNSVTEQQRKENHDRIATLLQVQTDRDRVDRTFEIANQYRLYPHIHLAPREFRQKVAEVFLKVGELGTSSFAFHSVLDYVLRGIDLLADQSWHKEPILKSKLYQLAADAAYLTGDLNRASTLLGVLTKDSPEKLYRANGCRIQMKLAAARNEHEAAINFGHQGLRELGYRTPRGISRWRAYLTLRWTLFTLRNFSLAQQRKRKGIRGPEGHAAVLLYANLISVASHIGDPTIAIYSSRMLKTALNNNDMNEAGSTLCFFAVNVKTFFNDVEEAYRLGTIARELSGKPTYALTNTTLLDGLINCWKEPLQETGHRLIDAYRSGIKTEDVEVAITAANYGASRLLFAGSPLSDMRALFTEIRDDAVRLRQLAQAALCEVYIEAVTWLTAGDEAEGWQVFEGKLIARLDDLDATGRAHCNILLAYLAVVFDKPSSAVDAISRAGPNLPAVSGLPITHIYYFVECLTLIGAEDASRRDLQLGKLRRSAGFAPMNFQHQVQLIEAELAASTKSSDAVTLFEQAAAQAETNEMFSDLALICERASQVLGDAGDPVAEQWRRRAKKAYSRWGLTAKIEELLEDEGKAA